MKITGYDLREALKSWHTRKDTAASQFNGSLMTFEGDSKPEPKEVIRLYLEAETNVALLQTEQMRYNLAVYVEVAGVKERVALALAIKTVGGLGRVEKMWRSAASEKTDLYSYREDITVREPGKQYAKRTISFEEAARLSSEAGRQAAAYRKAIAVGNATEIETSLPSTLFE